MTTPRLTDADRAIIDVLREGRNNAPNIARDTGYSRQYITERLRRLEEHEILINIGAGIYELDPDRLEEVEESQEDS